MIRVEAIPRFPSFSHVGPYPRPPVGASQKPAGGFMLSILTLLEQLFHPYGFLPPKVLATLAVARMVRGGGPS